MSHPKPAASAAATTTNPRQRAPGRPAPGGAALVALDGRAGGGQLLRAALTLAAGTGQGFHLHHLRADRPRPGLLRQHLTAVRAAAAICGAETEGATLRSQELIFRPGPLRGGDFRFAVGAAGSATLVLQTVLPALLRAPAPSTLEISGGTHTAAAPTFEFVAHSWLPLLHRMGAQVQLSLLRWGFFPAGGGALRAVVTPASPAAALTPLHLYGRGDVRALTARAASSHLNPKVARRELRALAVGLKTLAQTRSELDFPALQQEVVAARDSTGPGSVVWLQVDAAHLTAVFSAVGQQGISAEDVGAAVADAAAAWLRADVAVDPWLADQLLLPMALAGGGRFTTLALSDHSRAQITTLARFLPARVETRQLVPSAAGLERVEVTVTPTGSGSTVR